MHVCIFYPHLIVYTDYFFIFLNQAFKREERKLDIFILFNLLFSFSSYWLWWWYRFICFFFLLAIIKFCIFRKIFKIKFINSCMVSICRIIGNRFFQVVDDGEPLNGLNCFYVKFSATTTYKNKERGIKGWKKTERERAEEIGFLTGY